MRNWQIFNDSLAELQLIQSQIVLKLPASRESIHHQVHRIQQAQQALDRLYENVLPYSSRWRSPLNQSPKMLAQLIIQVSRHAESLKLLAEEFPVDPQGTMACLQHLCRRQTRLNEQLQQLGQGFTHPKSA